MPRGGGPFPSLSPRATRPPGASRPFHASRGVAGVLLSRLAPSPGRGRTGRRRGWTLKGTLASTGSGCHAKTHTAAGVCAGHHAPRLGAARSAPPLIPHTRYCEAQDLSHALGVRATSLGAAVASGERAHTPHKKNSPPRHVVPHASLSSSAAPKTVAQAAGASHIASGETATPYDNFKFAPIRESTVSRAMTSRYFKVRGGGRGEKREEKGRGESSPPRPTPEFLDTLSPRSHPFSLSSPRPFLSSPLLFSPP